MWTNLTQYSGFRIGDEFVTTVRVRNHAAEYCHHPQRHVQKFLNSPLGVRTANVKLYIAMCHSTAIF